MTVLSVNPESIEELLYSYGNGCSHRNLDGVIATVKDDAVRLRVGHVYYKAVFSNQESRVMFNMSLLGAGVNVEIN